MTLQRESLEKKRIFSISNKGFKKKSRVLYLLKKHPKTIAFAFVKNFHKTLITNNLTSKNLPRQVNLIGGFIL